MSKDTVTLVLNGEVTLQDFSTAIQEFRNLVEGLETDVAKNVHVEWIIDALEAGSATTTIRGIPEKESDVAGIEKVVRAYIDIGRSLEKKAPLNYSRNVIRSANKITSLINGRIRSVRFETDEDDVDINAGASGLILTQAPKVSEKNLGAVRGRIQSMSNRKQLRFTLYDIVDDHAVSCYLAPGSEDIMREAWGKLANVEGLVKRNPETGKPTTVRNIKKIIIIPEGQPGSWREAIGAAAGFLGDDLPEDLIRRGRDAN